MSNPLWQRIRPMSVQKLLQPLPSIRQTRWPFSKRLKPGVGVPMSEFVRASVFAGIHCAISFRLLICQIRKRRSLRKMLLRRKSRALPR